MDKTMMDAPCKGCEMLGCGPYHDQCEKYREYKAMVTEYRKRNLRTSEKRDYIKNAISRMKGRK